MNSCVWQPVLEQLPSWIEASVIDLPGHGQRTDERFVDLQGLTKDLQLQCEKIKKNNQQLVLIGWSLGGLACLQLLIDNLAEVDSLVLVSSNPCFISKENWNYGVDGSVFDIFSQSLKKDFSGTIRRFLSLQVKGSDAGRVVLRDLREKILQQPQPDESSLDAGLDILKKIDLRNQLKKIKQPVSWILGSHDGLIKAELAEKLDDVTVVNKAGHAPFLSHTNIFVEYLTDRIRHSS